VSKNTVTCHGIFEYRAAVKILLDLEEIIVVKKEKSPINGSANTPS
jgi:hypothetical protein